MNGCVSANILISCETSEDIFVILKDSRNIYVTSPVRRIDVCEQRAGVIRERGNLSYIFEDFGGDNFWRIGTLIVG